MRNYWNLSFGISLAMHSFIIAAGSLTLFNANTIFNEKKETKEIKIFVKETQPRPAQRTRLQQSQQTNTVVLPPPPYIKNVVRKLMGDEKERPLLDKAQILEKDTGKIVISEKLENSKLKSNPSYMSYYKGLRSKLNVICHKNYTGREQGEVFVSFVLSRDGRLESVKGDGPNKELINVAVRSVKESFPFMPFPPDLEGENYQFDISIYFKNN
ncbi:MAG: energy transducer TonB [Candidatus Omnitrophica bacterium]|nr:energy transducer TonB [Candidatus Omnitrophota bacterium]